MTSLRLAIDIGGTFTDTVLMSGDDTILATTKTLTTHDNPAEASLEGALSVLATAGRAPGDVTGFVHGTTLATNALIEKRGAKVATITTEGFRDILEIAYERRYAQYDLTLEKPDLLVPRDRAFTVRERMAVDGSVLIDMTASAIDDVLAEVEKSRATSVAICLLHAYANNAHEIRLKDALIKAHPDLSVSISSDISPEAREFDRLCTTMANAYIQPMMSRYLVRLADEFAAHGFTCPIHMMTAGGGMCTLSTASQYPIRLVESGPAGGAILAARIAADAGLDQVLSFDMGGTTAKLCLIDNARPQTSRQFEIARAARFVKGSGMPVRIPVIDMIEIGAGGGSIATVDRLGRLAVGPQSAGSEPGPAAFGRGGSDPTVTDADIELGYIRPAMFAEGKVALDAKNATDVLSGTIGAALNTSSVEAADGISRIVDESMASAARMHAVENGKDLRARTMIAFGGNGPLHATRVARSAGVKRIVVPPQPSVGSAVGFLYAPVSYEIVRSHYTLLDNADFEAVNSVLDVIEHDAAEVVGQVAAEHTLQVERSAFMRYNGQGHEIEIPLPSRPLTSNDIPALTSAFEAAYRQQFSRPVPGMQIEILNWRVHVSQLSSRSAAMQKAPPQRDVSIAETATISCDVDGTLKQAAVYDRRDLAPGDRLIGPALICEPQTTTLVSPDFTASVDGSGNLVLQRSEAGP